MTDCVCYVQIVQFIKLIVYLSFTIWISAKRKQKREKRPVAFFSPLTRIAILASFIRINKSEGGHDNMHRCEKRAEGIMKWTSHRGTIVIDITQTLIVRKNNYKTLQKLIRGLAAKKIHELNMKKRASYWWHGEN